MHAPPAAPASFATNFGSSRSKNAFSLVEVTLALGIVAFAFVALFGLLPAGMTVFRQSIDSANEMWIMQDFNSMVQVTDFHRLPELSFGKADSDIYYFDEEGRRTDTEKHQVSNRSADRIYAAKLLVEKAERLGGGTGAAKMQHGYQVLVLMAPYLNPNGMREFDAVGTLDDARSLPKSTTVRSRSFFVARMNSWVDDPDYRPGM